MDAQDDCNENGILTICPWTYNINIRDYTNTHSVMRGFFLLTLGK